MVGTFLVLVPNTFLSLFRVPATEEVWIRVAGTLLLVIGYYYLMASGKEMFSFYRGTVYGRYFVLIVFVLLVFAGLAPAVLVLFALIDGAAAAWTANCLRKEA